MIDQNTKQLIINELNKFVSHTNSANKAAAKLEVSNATISNIQNGKHDKISDDMWRKVSSALGLKLDEIWMHADTKPFKKLLNYLNNAQAHANVFGITVPPGSVKTHTLEYCRANYKNVFYVKCNRHTTERDFLSDALLSMGKANQNYRSAEMLKTLVREIRKVENPVFIIDEFEKVKPDTFLLSIDLYNVLEDVCGLVFLGTQNLKTKIELGVVRGKLGYNEYMSRIGGKFIEIPANDHDDAAQIIKAQGITVSDTMTVKGSVVNAIDHIITDSDNDHNEVDIRRVKRLVHAFKQKGVSA